MTLIFLLLSQYLLVLLIFSIFNWSSLHFICLLLSLRLSSYSLSEFLFLHSFPAEIFAIPQTISFSFFAGYRGYSSTYCYYKRKKNEKQQEIKCSKGWIPHTIFLLKKWHDIVKELLLILYLHLSPIFCFFLKRIYMQTNTRSRSVLHRLWLLKP